MNLVYVLPNGPHVLTVQAIDNATNAVVDSSVHDYKVASTCVTSSTVQCDMDQLPVDNQQQDCHPLLEAGWLANDCGGGIQGTHGSVPYSTHMEQIRDSGPLQNG